MANRQGLDRHQPTYYQNEVERLCGYLKNDSVIRWHLGCSQADIDRARARLARPVNRGYGSLPRSAQGDEMAEENQRIARAVAGNRYYLEALAKVAR